MTYREALREAFVSLLTSWRLLPRFGRELLGHFGSAAWALGAALLLLFGPVLALLSPLVAFLVLADERKRARDEADFKARVEAHYGIRRQRVQPDEADRDVG